MPDISRSVGAGAWNDKPDVLTVQQLLNKVADNLGGPSPKLVEDGLIGPKTIKAITLFQVSQLGWGDGRVDPGKATIQKLNNPGSVVPIGGFKPQGSSGGDAPPPDDGPPPGDAPPSGKPGGGIITDTPPKVVGALSAVSGSVRILRSTIGAGIINRTWIKGVDGLPVTDHDRIFAGETGRATVNFADGTRADLGPGGILVVMFPSNSNPTDKGAAKPPAVVLNRPQVMTGLGALGGWNNN